MAPKTKPASLNEPPVAGFSYDANNLTVTFDASASYDPDGSIANYSWTFGDNTAGHGKIVTHTYSANGTYNSTLTVADNGNEKNSTSKDIMVKKKTVTPPPTVTTKPKAVINVVSIVNLTVTLNGSDSEAPEGKTIVSYAWTFGDDSSATGAVVTHTYAKNGTYKVMLTVTDSAGAANSSSVEVTVTQKIVPSPPPPPPPPPHQQGPPGLLHAIEIHKLKADRNSGLQNSLNHLVDNLDRWLDAHGLSP